MVQDGDTHHVRGQDISLVLPGSHYTYKDITFFVENAKGVNAGCVEVTWQTMNTTSRPLTLAEMANLLLKDDSPMGLYTTYALLKTDRRYFRQVVVWHGMSVVHGKDVCRSVEIRHYTLECRQAKSKCCDRAKIEDSNRRKHNWRSRKPFLKYWRRNGNSDQKGYIGQKVSTG